MLPLRANVVERIAPVPAASVAVVRPNPSVPLADQIDPATTRLAEPVASQVRATFHVSLNLIFRNFLDLQCYLDESTNPIRVIMT